MVNTFKISDNVVKNDEGKIAVLLFYCPNLNDVSLNFRTNRQMILEILNAKDGFERDKIIAKYLYKENFEFYSEEIRIEYVDMNKEFIIFVERNSDGYLESIEYKNDNVVWNKFI